MAMKLYDLPLSPNARKVRAVIAELGLAVEVEVVNPREGKNRTPEYLKLNPNGKMPTLVDDGFAIWESNAILKYLAKREGKLCPKDLQGESLVDRWLFWQSAQFGVTVGKVGFERVLKPMFGLGNADEAIVAAATKDFGQLCRIMNTALEGKQYLTGELSVADFSIACSADFGLQSGLSFEGHPNAQAWFERMSSRESFKKSAPQR